MKVLIIEDEEKLAKYLKKGLEEEGITVDVCFSGRDGQSYVELSSNSLDLIILDLLLPDIDGINVCKSIRFQRIKTPILILTAKHTTDEKILGLDAGADDYLTKPFSLQELLARMRALTRRPKTAVVQELKVKNIILNPSKKNVTVGGISIHLTLKEFKLLEHLMQHSNQVISREVIQDKLWGMDFDSMSNVVDVHIKNLRKKIKDNDEFNILETVRGVGYRLNS